MFIVDQVGVWSILTRIFPCLSKYYCSRLRLLQPSKIHLETRPWALHGTRRIGCKHTPWCLRHWAPSQWFFPCLMPYGIRPRLGRFLTYAPCGSARTEDAHYTVAGMICLSMRSCSRRLRLAEFAMASACTPYRIAPGGSGAILPNRFDLVTHGHDLPLGRDPVSVGAYAVPCGHGLGFALDSWTATVVKWGCSIAAQISVLTTCATSTQADLAVRTAAI